MRSKLLVGLVLAVAACEAAGEPAFESGATVAFEGLRRYAERHGF